MALVAEWVARWVAEGSRVLDLGCGDGRLLAHLADTRAVDGLGVEIDPDRITACIRRGVSVVEQDLDQGLDNFPSRGFDTVIMSQALQAMRHPDRVLDAMLRIGRECIITFPNFGHWRCRTQLGLRGRMPVSRALPYYWYDTPNIHLCTVADFEALCRERGIRILHRAIVDSAWRRTPLTRAWPNLFGATAIYHVAR
jgi:methionine biosynthesis protein MetW